MDKRITLTVSSRLANMNRYGMLLALLAGVAVLFVLMPGAYFVMPQQVFLPLHTLLEFSSVLVAFMIFGVTWHSLSPTRPADITLLGCAMLASGLLDFGHTLSYKGMPDFVTPSSPEKGIAFWLAARLTVAAALCAASFMSSVSLHKPQPCYAMLFGFSLYVLLIYWLVLFHQPVLPHTFIEGQGLTEFKIACEWAIIGLLVIAASHFWQLTDKNGLKTYFFTAAIVFILSEMFFTQYKTTSDAFNVLGHLYKIIGDFLLFQAVFVSTIQAPYLEIEQQQTRYRQLFENMTSCGVVYQAVDNGCDFIFLEVNHAAERIEKIDRDTFIGRRVTELFPGVADFGLLDVLRRVWHTGRPEHFPVKYYEDGRIAGWRENYLYRLADGNIFAIYDDITERKLAKQALQESEKYFRAIFETSAIGMAACDPKTGMLSRVNLRFCQMLGYSAQELLSKTFPMITHPDDREKDWEGWLRLAHGEVTEYVTEKRYIHKDGHEIWAHLNVVSIRDENDRVLNTVATIVDITERKRMITELQTATYELQCSQVQLTMQNNELQNSYIALQEFNDRYVDLFDFAPIGYLTLTDKGLITEINLTGATLLGIDRTNALHRSIGSFLASEECNHWHLQNQRTLNHTEKQSGEFALRRDDGSIFYALLDCQRRDTSTSPMICISFSDITQRKQLERQFLQAQKMEALGQLTGGIAHDFNNILAAMLGYSNLALDRCVSAPSDKLAHYLGEVISAGERARDLIAKMLAYSRTSPIMSSAPLNMAPEVEKAVAMLSVAIPASIEIFTHIEPDTPSVRIDPIDIQQVLINLAVNARDAIGDHGRIDITLRRARINNKACFICGNFNDGDYVALEVKDSGNGIPADIQQRIFDPFFTTKDIGKGSGLGLSMIHGVIIKNNGHLLMETSFEYGTCFQLLFPFANAEEVSSAASIAKPIAPLAKHWRIWIVEDQKPLAAYYQEVLQGEGYRVTVFTDPVDALHAFQLDSDGLDLVFTDQTMPHLSGAELARAMLAIRPELPIILITGYSETINADEAKRLGIRRFLNKPVRATELLATLDEEMGVAANIQRL